ncbi:MAG: peptidase C1 [Gammaproteobacteria bacterium]|nr:peptidase C1 [Gammaproteobacteria bacterium]MDH3448543.1 peptidase C1 [Gammaproteobacteria bacterium]
MKTRDIETTGSGYPLSAIQDAPDLRDFPFEPSLIKLKKEVGPPNGLTILDQKHEGACTGFGLAAIINLLNRQRNEKVRVSPRMLYEMAKLHDEWPGEGYAGSSCRGAIKGWYNMGVCNDSEWKYVANKPDSLTVERARQARRNTIGAYYRVQPRISDFHAAINEGGAIFCSAQTHDGWQLPQKVKNKTKGKTEHVIEFLQVPRGGHAFAIVGYDEKGFWVQNSWGKTWGDKGLALWLYEDWQQNLMDAWVFALALSTPQIWHLPDQMEKNRSGLSLQPSPPRSEIAGHFIHVDDGNFHAQGRYWSNAEDVRTTAERLAENKKGYKHLLLYAHGGLNSPKASARRIAAMKNTFKENGIYPYHFMYDTGILEELKDVIFRRKQEVETRAGAVSDWTDRLIEWTTRIPGRALWREMKTGAELPFRPNRAGAQTLQIFLDALTASENADLTVHLVGHSTGGILLAHLLNAMEGFAPELRLGSCSLLAPACSVDLFRSHYYPYLVTGKSEFGIDKMQVFNLTDRLERDDQVGQVYRKSLLYLVSRAFEEDTPEAILGMKKYTDPLLQESDIKKLGNRFKVHYSSATNTGNSNSSTHGGFDNDVATMNSVLKTILGLGANAQPPRPFTRESLDY